MKKVLLMNFLYRPNIGGVENSISEISKILVDQGYIVDILCSDRNNEDNKPLKSYSIIDGANVYRFKYVFGKLSFFRNIKNSVILLNKLKKNNRYDYIISRNYILVIVGNIVGFNKIKYIPPQVTYFLSSTTDSKPNLKNCLSHYLKILLESLGLFLSNEVYVFSDSMVKQTHYISLGLVNSKKVEPGIDLNKFIPSNLNEKHKLRILNNIPRDKRVILALGRYSELKQYDLAILAMQYLNDEYLLLLVGSGPELDNYKQLISSNNLGSKVRILESTDTPEDMYKLSDAFIMTSKYESFGQTILEAYASHLKIIGFSKESGVNTNIEDILSNYDQVFLADRQASLELSNKIKEAFAINNDSNKLNIYDNSILNERYSWSRFIQRIGIPIKSVNH